MPVKKQEKYNLNVQLQDLCITLTFYSNVKILILAKTRLNKQILLHEDETFRFPLDDFLFAN